MTVSRRQIFVNLKRFLLVLFVVGLTLAIVDEGLRVFRARQNKEGTIVYGFALYEKALASPTSVKNWSSLKNDPNWEFVEFYQHKFECELWRFRRQGNWEDERKRKLRARPDDKSLWQLPVVRYECGPSRKRYEAGQGWGLF